MRQTITVKRLVAFGVLSLVVFILYSLFWYGTLRVTGLPTGTVASVDGKTYTHDQLQSGLRVRPGEHRLFVTSPLIKPYNSTEKVNAFSQTVASPNIPILSADELVEFVASPNLAQDLRIAKGRLFENNTWMTVAIGSKTGQTDGYIDIYQYRNRIWKIFDSGTGFDLEESSDSGYPDSIVRYLRGEE